MEFKIKLQKSVTFLCQIWLVLTLLILGDVITSNAQITQRGAVTSSTSTNGTITINVPAGVMAGDIMIANIAYYNNGTNTQATNNSWNFLYGYSLDRGYGTILYKVVTNNVEPASYSFTVNSASNSSSGAIVAFSGVNTSTNVVTDIFDYASTGSTTIFTPAATTFQVSGIPAISTSIANEALILFANTSRITSTSNANFSTWTSNAGAINLTELYDVGSSSGSTAVGAAILNPKAATGTTGTGGFKGIATRICGAQFFGLKPAPCVAPSINTQPSTSAQSACLNAALPSLSVQASGSSLSYQWYKNTANSTTTPTPTLITGATSSSYPPPSTSTGTSYYFCVISNSCGSVTSAVSGANTVNALPTASISGTSTSCGGTVSLTASGGTSYLWSGGSTPTSATNTFNNTGSYTVTVTGANGCTANATQAVTITPQPSATIAYSNSSICNSVTGTVTPTITGTSGGTFSSTSGLTINSSGAITPSTSTVGGPYRVTYTIPATGACVVFTTYTDVTILNAPVYSLSYSSLNYCSNYAGIANVIQNTAPTGGTYTASPSTLSINSTTGAIDIAASVPDLYTITYSFSSAGCVTSVQCPVRINVMPTITVPANFGTCLNSPAFTLTGASANPYIGTYSGTGVSSGQFNPSVGLGTYTIIYTVAGGGGCVNSDSFRITVVNSSPTITATPTNSFVYSGNFNVINLSSSVPGTQYTWTVISSNPAVSGYSNQTTPATGPINQQLFNASPTVGELTYTITPALVGCTGTPVSVVISLPSTTFCESPGTFQKGSCIIDMGVVPQTYGNGLKPYGLLYKLLNVAKVPVYWAINPNKTFESTLPKVDEADFTVDGRTFKGGSFIVPAGYLTQAQSLINSWRDSGVVVYYTLSGFTPPIYELLTRIPRVVLDAAYGATIQNGFYAKAGIFNTGGDIAYTLGGVPVGIGNCDDIYVLPHAEPTKWTQLYKDSLLNFINNRGWLFSSCKAVSQLENLTGMNFLSSTGLVSDSFHVNGTPPYSYSLESGAEAASIASDPFTQSIGILDSATLHAAGSTAFYAAESIYLPKTTWRPSTKIAIYDAGFLNVGSHQVSFNGPTYTMNNQVPYTNTAAILAYGRAFGIGTKGYVLYLAGHDLVSAPREAQNVAAARIYGNFILRSGIGTRPKINPVSIPASANSGQTITLSVSIPPSTSTIDSMYWSSDLTGVFSNQYDSVTQFTAPAVDVPTLCTVQFKVKDACNRYGLYCTTILINPTIKNNYIGTYQTICSNTVPTTLTGSVPVAPGNAVVTYQWLISYTSATAGFSNAPGVSNLQNYTPPALTQTCWIRRQVTSTIYSVISTAVQITVQAGPTITTQPSTVSQAVCGGAAFTSISVATNDAPVTFQWYSNTTASNVGGNQISGATSSILTPPSNTGSTTYYFCGVTNSFGCTTNSNASGAFSVTAPVSNSSIVSNISNLNQTYCLGQTIAPLTISLNTAVSRYAWYRNSISSYTGATLIADVYTTSSTCSYTPSIAPDTGFYYFCRIVSASGCSGFATSGISGLIRVNSLPTPSITNNSGTTVITCSNRTIGVTASGGASYSWSNGLGTNATANIIDSGRYTVTVTGANGCSAPASITITSGITGSTWVGTNSSAWNDETNWCGKVPTDTSSVIIPAGTPNDPVISGTVMAKVKNITILPGATLYLDGQQLQVYGTINSNGNLNAVNGDIELAGTASDQSISGSMFMAHRIKNLKLSNSNGVSFSGTNDTVRVTGALEFGNSNVVLTTNDNLTLASDINGTASVGDLTLNGTYNGNKILGNVTVERFVPNHSKAWQFLAAPTTGQTIKAAWQEGADTVTQNPKPGYGTIITGNFGGSTLGAHNLGFDIYTPAGPSLKTYNDVTGLWDGVPSTNMLIDNNKGYMLMVRGDRSVNAYGLSPTSLTLRTTGLLYQPVNSPASITVQAGKFASVGNPYASAIDVSKIVRTGGVQDIYYVWDPKLTISTFSAWGLGGYQCIYKNGNSYEVIPGGGSYANGNVNIQSGQAFFVKAVGTAGTVSFAENCKTAGSNLFTRNADEFAGLFTRIYGQTSTDTVLLDGVLSLYHSDFNNDINEFDAIKMQNSGSENISILRGVNKLTAEQRSTVLTKDTIFYQLTGLRRQTYLLKLNAHDFGEDGVSGKLIDKYLNTVTPINDDGELNVSFSVTTDPLSAAADRFMVVFENMGILPVTFTSIKATRLDKSKVVVDWKTENASAIAHYEIQRSTDGRNFSTWANVLPDMANSASANYSNLDVEAQSSLLYYRVKSIGVNGAVQYSSIVKVLNTADLPKAYVWPNPVENKLVHVHFENIRNGNYQLVIQDALGKKMISHQIAVSNINEQATLKLPAGTASGYYWLTIRGEDGFVEKQKILVQ